MIHTIEIENFRCFGALNIEGIKPINLIGGKNNSGKTCLLEAIACLSNKFDTNSVANIRSQTSIETFCNNAKTNKYSINLVDAKVEHCINSHIINMSFSNYRIQSRIPINFITQKTELPKLDIVSSFDNFDAKLLKEKLIEILNLVDSRIEDIRTFRTKDGLYIKLKEGEYQSIKNFGDATVNLIRYFTPILEKALISNSSDNFSVLLIDEIENGLHFTSHLDFWKNVFVLAKELNVQIFATTHSLEMIKAFCEASKLNANESMYIEMARDFDTGEVFAETHDIEQLEYELENPKSTFRGE